MSFSMDDVLQVLQIVKECKDAQIHVETSDIKLTLFKGDIGEIPGIAPPASAPICLRKPAEPAVASATPLPQSNLETGGGAALPAEGHGAVVSQEGLLPVKADVASIFYRRPNPNEPPFVEVGDEVQEDSVLCLLEVMKCFSQVTAGVRGVVEKICVESNSLVEQGTVLFLIRPK